MPYKYPPPILPTFVTPYSHPNDYTPVCTTELGEAGLRIADFTSRGVKLLGLSCNTVEDHGA